jgi:hypothetical protein
MGSLIDLVGHRFDRLVVTHRVPGAWACSCACGGYLEVPRYNLLSGATRSCGCLRRESAAAKAQIRNLKHGHTSGGRTTPTWISWKGMLARCKAKRGTAYEYYVLRGIKVCKRWRKFENFLADMGERPPGKTLDRENNDGNYEPGNCRWATRVEQQSNRRGSRVLTLNGVTKTLSQWARELDAHPERIYSRLKKGWSVELALTKPLRKSSNRRFSRTGLYPELIHSLG